MEEKVMLAALAGLLHDIGKFAQRAGVDGTRLWDNEGKADFGYFHALLTSDFIEEFVPEVWKLDVKNTASSHHKPHGRLDWAVALADHLSAGETADPIGDSRAAQPRQMLSIFCDISADGQKAPAKAYLPLSELRLQCASLFPGPAWDQSRVDQAYANMWQEFRQEAAALRQAYQPGGDPESYLESLLLLLQRFTWSMPSAYYQGQPDINLYDHCRMTAALAAILSTASLSDGELQGLAVSSENYNQPLAALVGGDLSGVQDFLYTISARGATSALRGRSFYLQLLTEALARFCLRQLDLPITNLVYAGGGNFYLLVRPGDIDRLAEIQGHISRVLFRHHRGDLYLALAAHPLTGQNFYHGGLSSAWEQLGQGLQAAKLHRFAELGADLSQVFMPQGHGGNEEQQCQVCGMEHPGTKVDPKSGESEVQKCPACLSYEGLGESLRDADFLALQRLEIPPSPDLSQRVDPGEWQDVLSDLGMGALVLRSDELDSVSADAPTTLFALDDEVYQQGSRKIGPNLAYGRRLVVNVTPKLTEEDRRNLRDLPDLPAVGSTKPFHAMAAQSTGIKRLGVLRMDVDNLGDLFSKGLGPLATLSRVASLSSAFSLFFEGWVEVVAATMNKKDSKEGKGDRLYSIYSGGDDLFFVGAWDQVVELARQVRIDLGKYVANHPGIHLSGGMVLVGGKYPLSQAAEDALRAEQSAKAHRWSDEKNAREKDSFCFLGQALPWQVVGLEPGEEPGIETAHSMMCLLKAQEKQVRGSLIRRLIHLYGRYQDALVKRALSGEDVVARGGQAQVLYGRWNWLADYTLYRLAGQYKNRSIDKLREQLKKDNFHNIEWVGLGARWAELLLREDMGIKNEPR